MKLTNWLLVIVILMQIPTTLVYIGLGIVIYQKYQEDCVYKEQIKKLETMRIK